MRQTPAFPPRVEVKRIDLPSGLNMGSTSLSSPSCVVICFNSEPSALIVHSRHAPERLLEKTICPVFVVAPLVSKHRPMTTSRRSGIPIGYHSPTLSIRNLGVIKFEFAAFRRGESTICREGSESETQLGTEATGSRTVNVVP